MLTLDSGKLERKGVDQSINQTNYASESAVDLEDLTEEQLTYFETQKFLKQKACNLTNALEKHPIDFGLHLLQKVTFRRFARVSQVAAFWSPMIDIRVGEAQLTFAIIDNRSDPPRNICFHRVDASEPFVIAMNMSHSVDLASMRDIMFATKIDGIKSKKPFMCGHIIMNWNIKYSGTVEVVDREVFPPVRLPRQKNNMIEEFKSLISMVKEKRAKGISLRRSNTRNNDISRILDQSEIVIPEEANQVADAITVSSGFGSNIII